jgi:hypothetical protein
VDENGQPVTGRARFDAEALVHRKDGSWLVAFERDHRIEQYKDFSIAPVPFVLPPGLSPLPRNQGLEALTELPDGRLFAIAEAAGSDGMHSAWLWQSGNWLKLNYQPAAGLRPSDMASLPNGDVLVLERWFNVFYGFRIRIARLDGRDLREGSSVAAQTLAELESPMITENFEAISTETLQDGTVRIYLSSDNNFNAAQQTILAVFDLSPDSPPSR